MRHLYYLPYMSVIRPQQKNKIMTNVDRNAQGVNLKPVVNCTSDKSNYFLHYCKKLLL